jgi:DNA-binding response OmpR family regulator
MEKKRTMPTFTSPGAPSPVSRERARKNTGFSRIPQSQLPARILSVSPNSDDHSTLRSILWDRRWCIATVDTFAGALEFLNQENPHIIVCERDLSAATWRDLLRETEGTPDPPLLIVTSRLADDYLWAEVLNLGGYDVLVKPFRADEVRRVCEFAAARSASMPPDQRFVRSSSKCSLVSGAGV